MGRKPHSKPTTSVKVVLLGDSGVGKSSLLYRYIYSTFHPFQEPTIGAAFLSKTIELPDRFCQLKLWDTAGQERYQSLTPLYFRGASVALLVFDICRLHSFQTLQRWVRELDGTVPILIVVGNKADLVDHRSVQESDARYYAEQIGAMYIETSAKEDMNVNTLFEAAVERVASTLPTDSDPQDHDVGNLDLSSENVNPSRGCCYSS